MTNEVNENVVRTREAYAAFARGDIAVVAESMTDDVVWHVTGEGPLTGDYRGPLEVLAYFGKLIEATNGNLEIEVADVLANDRIATAIVHVHAEREGRVYDQNNVHVLELQDGKVKQFWAYDADPVRAQEFWA